MDRNTTIAFVLIGAILIIWLFMNTPEQKETPKSRQDSTTVIKDKKEESVKIIKHDHHIWIIH